MELWSQDEERFDYDDAPEEGSFALVNGAVLPLEVGSSLKTAVQGLARDAGFGKFRVLINDEEVRPSEAPEVVSENMRVELRPYDVAGN